MPAERRRAPKQNPTPNNRCRLRDVVHPNLSLQVAAEICRPPRIFAPNRASGMLEPHFPPAETQQSCTRNLYVMRHIVGYDTFHRSIGGMSSSSSSSSQPMKGR
eukprot:353152-Amphidinium_carterae.1